VPQEALGALPKARLGTCPAARFVSVALRTLYWRDARGWRPA
jgi:hypothetical protein